MDFRFFEGFCTFLWLFSSYCLLNLQGLFGTLVCRTRFADELFAVGNGEFDAFFFGILIAGKGCGRITRAVFRLPR